jgi:hypothetical protein
MTTTFPSATPSPSDRRSTMNPIRYLLLRRRVKASLALAVELSPPSSFSPYPVTIPDPVRTIDLTTVTTNQAAVSGLSPITH